ncbi:MAG: 4'-phosphopantetheinyl transferase family protein [Acidimicrobiia bacterium]
MIETTTHSSVSIRLTSRHVHLWTTRLDRRPVVDTLSPDEHARADRFLRTEHRASFIARRTWMREVLGVYTGRSARELTFRYQRVGKPQLAASDAVEFSLSHSGDMALFAISAHGPVGADVEAHRVGAYDRDGASLVLSPEEIGAIDVADDPDRAFLRRWVRKEALGKATGAGLERHLAAHSFYKGPGAVEHDGFRISSVDVGGLYEAAVATTPGAIVTMCGPWPRTRVSGGPS